MEKDLPCVASDLKKLTSMLLVTAAVMSNFVSNGDTGATSPRPAVDQHKNITDLLDSLLKGYNKHLRPGFGGPPIRIETNILIRSMGLISEEMMLFSMDCYFRQYWTDERLRFDPIMSITENDTEKAIDELRPSIKMLDEIWKPDTFFLNGKESYLHTITYSNKLFRIKQHGNITYSQRLTIKSSCPLQLTKYPMDNQSCPLAIASYGYSDNDVQVRWIQTKPGILPVTTYSGIQMAQFVLTTIQTGEGIAGSNHGNRRILEVQIHMRREIGYFFLQIYLPCYLIVIISWVSFWINREATPARVMLGITTLLTTCTIGITGRTGIPKVSYSTALDIYFLMCFGYVFAALVEYAGVNYFTKGCQKDFNSEDEENDPLMGSARHNGRGRPHIVTTDINGHTMITVTPPRQADNCWRMFMHCLKGNTKYRHFKSLSKGPTLSVSRIDTLSRFIFPFTFIILNIIYWVYFYYS